MKIKNLAYIRLSCGIGISDTGTPTRSGWFNKRKKLLQLLDDAGINVILTTRPTKDCKGMWEYPCPVEKVDSCEACFIEFASENYKFHKTEIDESCEIIKRFKNKLKIFMSDDPDILKGNMKIIEKISGVSLRGSDTIILLNADVSRFDWNTYLELEGATVLPFYIGAMLDRVTEPAAEKIQKILYLGNAEDGSRKKIIDAIRSVENFPIDIVSNKKGGSEIEAPTQPERLKFMSKYVAFLGLSDTKHKKMSWKTGRVEYAALAGIPVFVESKHSVYVSEGYTEFADIEDLKLLVKKVLSDGDFRKNLVERQYKALDRAKEEFYKIFKKVFINE